MTNMPTPSPFEAPVPGAEIAAQKAALSSSITPSAAPMEAGKLLGSVSPGIMSILVATGAAALMLVGMKTVVTGKPPWKQKESLI